MGRLTKGLALAVALPFAAVPFQSLKAATYFYHNDHLGTPQVLTDQNQQVVWQGSQEPFGENTPSTSLVNQNIRFPGQYFDEETGMHYNYFRTYDTTLGRFSQSDPIGLQGGLNRFIYGNNDAISRNDPLGLFDVGGNQIEIGDRSGYRFKVTFYDKAASRFARDYGRLKFQRIDALAFLFKSFSNKTGVSDLPKSDRGVCDVFDVKAREVFEEMFGNSDTRVDSSQLLEFILKLETMEDYPSTSYPEAADFVRKAEDRAFPSPRSIARGL